MSKFSEELKKKHLDQENRRIGDVYTECEKRGCKRSFLEAFNTRIELYPMKQTLTFLDLLKQDKEVDEKVRQWRIYLQVLIELRPNHEKHDEWEKALENLEND